MRAYKQTTLRDGDGDAFVERVEFPALLRNLLYFNKLFSVFEDVDTDHDRRLSLEEFQHGCGRLGLKISPEEATKVFTSMNTNNGSKILFDEFCAWVAETSCPVDDTVVTSYTTTDSRPKENKKAAMNGNRANGVDGPSTSVGNAKFDAVEKEFKDLLGNSKHTEDLLALWDALDSNKNNTVSLAEIDRLVVCDLAKNILIRNCL